MAFTTGKKQCQIKPKSTKYEFCNIHKKRAALGTLPYGRCDNPLSFADALQASRTRSPAAGWYKLPYGRCDNPLFADALQVSRTERKKRRTQKMAVVQHENDLAKYLADVSDGAEEEVEEEEEKGEEE